MNNSGVVMRKQLLVAAVAFGTTPALADSHLSEAALLGEAAFKFCQSCHVVRDEDGNTIAGRSAKSGPNLYGVIGRQAGTVEKFRYGKHMIAAGDAGLIWNEESVAAFLADPKGFIKTELDDNSARTKMVLKLRPDRKNDLSVEDVAANIAAFLAEVGPTMETEPTVEELDTDG